MNNRVIVCGSIIYRPEEGKIYCVSGNSPSNKLIITFSGGELLAKISSYNWMANFLRFNNDNPRAFYGMNHKNFISLPSQHVFFDSKLKAILPPLLSVGERYPNTMIKIKEINIRVINKAGKISGCADVLCSKTPLSIPLINENIREEVQCLTQDVPVQVQAYPIFLPAGVPNKDMLDEIHDVFLTHNDDSKLKKQFAKTPVHCSLRAHFATVMFGFYGIQCTKVYKHWSSDAWDGFPQHKTTWKFHCAAMIRRAENEYWVFDPWEGLNHQFLPLKNWLFRSDEPKPITICVSSNMLVRYSDCFTPTAVDSCTGDMLQFMFKDAIPNSPKRTIPLKWQNNLGLFRSIAVVKRARSDAEDLKKQSNIASLPALTQ